MLMSREKYTPISSLDNDQFWLFATTLFHGQASREWLTAQSPWGKTKTDLIARSLSDKGILTTSTEESSNKGRNPLFYTANPRLGYFLGFTSNFPYDRLVLEDFNGNVVSRGEYPGSLPQTDSLSSVCRNIRKFVQEQQISLDDIWAIGGHAPGILEDQTGVVKKVLRQPHREELDFKHALEETFSIPVWMESSRILTCLKEYRFSLLESQKTFVNVHISLDVGLALFINGKSYRGADGFAGEFGHLSVPESQKPCYCGNTGCLVTHLSSWGVCSDVQAHLENGTVSQIDPRTLQGPDYEKGIEHIIDMALQNDKLSINVLEEVGMKLGKALASVITLFNPELLIIHCHFTRSGELFTAPVRQMIRKYSVAQALQKLQIEFVPVVAYTVPEGAAILAMRRLIKQIATERNISF